MWPFFSTRWSAAGNLLLLIPQPGPAVVADPAGVQWKVRAITLATAFVSIFVMGGFALLAWLRRPRFGAAKPMVPSFSHRARLSHDPSLHTG